MYRHLSIIIIHKEPWVSYNKTKEAECFKVNGNLNKWQRTQVVIIYSVISMCLMPLLLLSDFLLAYLMSINEI